MASIVSVVVSDDLDGSDNAETVSFGIDGVSYEIDLNAKNRGRLDKALAPYVKAGRRVPRSANRRARRSPAPSIDRAAVRAWARAAGMKVSERGRISGELMRQYEAAQ